jgi:hypothetical protein
MDLDYALRRYREDRFNDDDVADCTGLTERAYRELIKVRAVRTTTQRRGPGRVRLCDAITFKRAAVIAAINRAGFSLAVSGQIAYFLPFHTVLYEICDPSAILLESSASIDPETGLPPRVEQPKVNWFDPNKTAKADPRTDWLIEICEARFVGVKYAVKGEPTIFGDLREEGTRFAAWFPHNARAQFIGSAIAELAKQRLPYGDGLVDFVADWEDPTVWSKDLRSLGYEYENHDTDHDQLRLAAEAMARSPVFKTTINVSLALRRALRRYLGIDSANASL